MENSSLAEQKISLIQSILAIDKLEVLVQLQTYLDELNHGQNEQTDTDAEPPEAKGLSFEEWNNQFDDDRSLDEYLPEYGVTLGDFRRNIYESESGEETSIDEFFKDMEQW